MLVLHSGAPPPPLPFLAPTRQLLPNPTSQPKPPAVGCHQAIGRLVHRQGMVISEKHSILLKSQRS